VRGPDLGENLVFELRFPVAEVLSQKRLMMEVWASSQPGGLSAHPELSTKGRPGKRECVVWDLAQGSSGLGRAPLGTEHMGPDLSQCPAVLGAAGH
jgi:hypothetical protein